MNNDPPFFSIALTTHDRDELLRQTLRSVLAQDYVHFEVLVGNNNPARPLTTALLDTGDKRVRIVNHPADLGQHGNISILLGLARGRYFTQLADDDCYAPDYLSAAHAALMAADLPAVLFSGYDLIHGTDEPAAERRFTGRIKRMTGERFLWEYLTGKIQSLGTMGLFSIDYARGGAGWAEMREPLKRLFGEFLFLVRAGLLDEVVYLPDPLVRYRVHPGAWGVANTEWELYHAAADALVAESAAVLREGGYKEDYFLTVLGIANVALRQIVAKFGGRAEGFDAGAFLQRNLAGAGLITNTGEGPLLSRPVEVAAVLMQQFADADIDRSRKEIEIRRLKSECEIKDTALLEKEAEIGRLRAECDGHVGEMAIRMADWDRTVSELRTSLLEKEGEIRRLKAECVAKDEALLEKEAEIERLAVACRGQGTTG